MTCVHEQFVRQGDRYACEVCGADYEEGRDVGEAWMFPDRQDIQATTTDWRHCAHPKLLKVKPVLKREEPGLICADCKGILF